VFVPDDPFDTMVTEEDETLQPELVANHTLTAGFLLDLHHLDNAMINIGRISL